MERVTMATLGFFATGSAALRCDHGKEVDLFLRGTPDGPNHQPSRWCLKDVPSITSSESSYRFRSLEAVAIVHRIRNWSEQARQ
jgi:hypothetical protein